MAAFRRRCLALAALLCCGLPGRALLPALTDHTLPTAAGERTISVPRDWQLAPTETGLRMQRDPQTTLFGAASLEFFRYETAPSPDTFIHTALDRWAGELPDFEVLEVSAPDERPRVRLAKVRFRLNGFVCSGSVMAVIGRQTGTLGFGYAEAVTARRLQLDELVPLLVAGTYEAFPVRAVGADPAAAQAQAQAVEGLYGSGGDDLKSLLTELDDNGQMDLALLGRCGMFQPLLRSLKSFLVPYLSEREQERIGQAEIYCIPGHDFNAFALGRNDLGPGFVAFFAGMCDPFARAAEHYCALREQGLPAGELSGRLTDYTSELAVAILAGEPLPEPESIDWADQEQVNRFVKVFNSMIGTVMAHEMAHYYMRHSESGQTPDPHSIQQREVAADAAAVRHLQHVADESSEFWEGGIIHCFGLFATIDNVMKQATGAQQMPEYMSTHPFGETRLSMAAAMVGDDNLAMRHDPWNPGGELEASGAGVQVVGGLGQVAGLGGGAPPDIPAGGTPVFQHPVSGARLPVPAGWEGMFDPATGLVVMARIGQDGTLPMIGYSTGGDYPSARAVVEDVLANLRASAGPAEVLRDEPLQREGPPLEAHLMVAHGNYAVGPATIVSIGILAGGQAHGLLLLTADPEADVPVLLEIFGGMQF